MAEKKNITRTIVLTEHTYLDSAWLRKEFSKATDEEKEMLIHKHENSLYQYLYKRTCFYIISAEGRNLKFITWLCNKLTEITGYMYEAKLVFNDKKQTAMVVIDENKESKETYIKSRYVPETKKVDEFSPHTCDFSHELGE